MATPTERPPTTRAAVTSALDRIDRLLDQIDDASARALERITSKETSPDDHRR